MTSRVAGKKELRDVTVKLVPERLTLNERNNSFQRHPSVRVARLDLQNQALLQQNSLYPMCALDTQEKALKTLTCTRLRDVGPKRSVRELTIASFRHESVAVAS